MDEQATFEQMMALEQHGPDTYVGVGPSYPWGGLYGGQIVAQALRAAGLTVDEQYLPHSLHAYFIRPGDPSEPIRFEVDRIRNGRSFTTRRVVARQSIGAIFNLAASFHLEEPEADVQAFDLEPAARTPDDFLSDGWSHVFDRRSVGDVRRNDDGRSMAWMRMVEPVPDDPVLRACAVAYLSDDLPTEGAITLHPDRRLVEPGAEEHTFMNASLDHAIWFHQPSDFNGWHLFDMDSPKAHGALGLNRASVFTQDGRLVASIAQEGLMRMRQPQ